MIHYHGCPITPREALYSLAGRFFCNSFAKPQDVAVCHEIGQGNMLDNGAFTTWRVGRESDWRAWAEWAEPWLDYLTTWCVLPDAIDGGEGENDALLREWGIFGEERAAPVWHLDEPISRLLRLCDAFPRVCFGSAGAYRTIGSHAWHVRVSQAFDALADADGRVRVWIHMLRGMNLSGGPYPFSSVDSTDVGRNHNRQQNTAAAMAARWDSIQCPARWSPVGEQLALGQD